MFKSKRSVWALLIGVGLALGIVGLVHELNVGKVREPLGRWVGTKWAAEQIKRAASLFISKSQNPTAY